MVWLKHIALSLATSVISLAVCLVFAEMVLRFMPVSTGFRSEPVDAQHPIFHFTPNRAFVYSFGWTMQRVVRGRVNNVGFVNDQNYVRDHPLPLLAVIGDSFIEARMVPYPQTTQGRLADALNGKMRVYSFAASGAPLSQYLAWADQAVHEYGARAIVINVVGNDFDESHIGYKVGPGFWLYEPDTNGELRLRLIDHRPSWLISAARESALARYVILNLRLHETVFRVRGLGEMIFGAPARAQPRYAGNTEAAATATRISDSLKVIDAFFRDLPVRVGLPPTSLLLTLDGFRYPDAQREGAGTYFDVMREHFLAKARELGYEAIDLDSFFIDRHLRTGEHFEYPDDNHWSSIGHAVEAQAIARSNLMTRLLETIR